MKSGAKLTVTAYDRANVKTLATGTVSTFDNQIDTTTGTFKLRAQFDNADNALFPNQFVNVKLLVDTMPARRSRPTAAIQLGASGSYVYVVNADKTVAVRKVKTGPADAKNTVILSGLTAGENVVIDGIDRLRDGAKVVGAQRRRRGGRRARRRFRRRSAHKRAPDQGEAAPKASATTTPSPSQTATP